MEVNDRLILWALGQRALGQLDYQLVHLNWPQKLGANLFDVEVRLNYTGHVLEGRGTAATEQLAIAIAFSEALERVFAVDLHTSSNGIACHQTAELAEIAAQNELIERDAFLISYLCGTPIVDLPLSMLSENLQIPVRHLQALGQSVHLFGLGRSRENAIVMCVIEGLTRSAMGFGINVGLGCEATVARACEKATTEAVRNGIWATEKTEKKEAIQSQTLPNFLAQTRFTPRDHLALSLDPEYGSQVMEELHSRTRTSELPQFPSAGEFLFTPLRLPPTLPQPPVEFVLCQNEEMQNIFWGPTTLAWLNKDRLSSVSVKWQERINTLPPHPLG